MLAKAYQNNVRYKKVDINSITNKWRNIINILVAYFQQQEKQILQDMRNFYGKSLTTLQTLPKLKDVYDWDLINIRIKFRFT